MSKQEVQILKANFEVQSTHHKITFCFEYDIRAMLEMGPNTGVK